MSWGVKKHIIAASFPRQWRAATRTPDARLQLVINEYIPRDNSNEPGAITIVLAHANGFHKEMYEPMLETLLKHTRENKLPIRSIWAIDAAHQGESGVLNEQLLGDEPSWYDYARDIMHTVQHFRDQMPEPRIGMGHSMGACAVFQSAIWHPRIFQAVVGIDPVIESYMQEAFPVEFNPASASQRRRDIWPDRTSAEAAFKKSPFFQTWDPRVLDIHVKYGLRDLPTFTYPNEKGVTLTTTKHQEVWTFCRKHPSMPGELHRPEPGWTFDELPKMPVQIMYVFGENSVVCREDSRERKMQQNPTAQSALIAKAGHLVPFEKPVETADAISPFLAQEWKKWKVEFTEDWKRPRDVVMSAELRKTLTPSRL